MNNETFIDIHEASAITGLAVQTLRRRCHERSVPHYKIGKLLFKKSELLEWIKQTRRPTKFEIAAACGNYS